MIGRAIRALWSRSPAERISNYETWLFNEVYESVAAAYPKHVLSRERFSALIGEYRDHSQLRRFNRYLGDLWYLFAPDFQDRLPEYYRDQDLPLMMTLLSYAGNAPLLQANYIRPYELACRRSEQLSILEYGAGVPHGLLHRVLTRGSAFCRHVTTVDIDGTPARFVKAFCARHNITHRYVQASAGTAVYVDAPTPFDFIFAKDVFEHLADPEAALDGILRATGPQTMLALDLDDKGSVSYQHVSPALEPLKRLVERAGFSLVERTGNVSIYSWTA